MQKEKERGKNRKTERQAQTDRGRERESERHTESYQKSETLKIRSEKTKSLFRLKSVPKAFLMILKSNLYICIFDIISVFSKYLKARERLLELLYDKE